MKKITLKLLIISFFIFAGNTTIAQISKRENNPTTFRIGTRPVQGNWGFSGGYTFSELDTFISGSNSTTAIPLINIKYYFKDDIAFIFGMKTYKRSTTYSGDINPDNDVMNRKFYENKDVTVKNFITLGAEKHFLVSNILDPYVGVSIPLGYYREAHGTKEIYKNDDKGGLMKTKFSFLYGFNLYIGTQVFIADLPLSIGFETGLAGLGLLSDKYKVETSAMVSGTLTDYTYYTTDADPTGTRFSSLSSSKFASYGFVRFNLNYYFN